MSTKIEDGGPAFPRADSGYSITQDGMSLRDWFAGQAMAAILSDPSDSSDGDSDEELEAFYRAIAESSYMLADALLSARNSGGAS